MAMDVFLTLCYALAVVILFSWSVIIYRFVKFVQSSGRAKLQMDVLQFLGLAETHDVLVDPLIRPLFARLLAVQRIKTGKVAVLLSWTYTCIRFVPTVVRILWRMDVNLAQVLLRTASLSVLTFLVVVEETHVGTRSLPVFLWICMLLLCNEAMVETLDCSSEQVLDYFVMSIAISGFYVRVSHIVFSNLCLAACQIVATLRVRRVGNLADTLPITEVFIYAACWLAKVELLRLVESSLASDVRVMLLEGATVELQAATAGGHISRATVQRHGLRPRPKAGVGAS